MKEFLEISDVKFKDKDVPPILAFFENGTLNFKSDSEPECGIYRDNEAPDKYIAAVCTKDKLLFMGNEPDNGLYRTLLAVQVKGTNKVQLIEADKVILKPRPLAHNPPLTTYSGAGTTGELYKKFGSKQNKRKTEQRDRTSFNIQSFENRLNETVTNISLDESINVVDNISYYGTYVKCNTQATVADNVYNLDDIISEQELEELNDEALTVLGNTPEDNAANYSEYFTENFKELPSGNKEFRTKVLLYSECIVQFLALKRNEVCRKHSVVCPLSNIISTKLLDSFTELTEKGRTRGQSMKDKSLSHAIVAGLIACNFRLRIAPLTKMGLMPQARLLKLCRSLGATQVAKEANTTVVLKTPLPLPLKTPAKRK